MALVVDVDMPSFAGAAPGARRATLWIATDAPPFQAQSWPLLLPIPQGWHEVSETEALAIVQAVPTTGTFRLVAGLPDAASEVVALSTAEPSPAAVAARRLPRAPREPRFPRTARAGRMPRPSRLFREERAPRPPRKPRKPRAERKPRKPRKPRPANYKTREKPGICKGPACTCWTPAGCVGDWYIELLPQFKGSDCLRGPCFSYELCMSDKCQVHPSCTVNQIIQFWARQYQAAVTWVEPVIAPVLAPLRRVARPSMVPTPEPPAPAAAPSTPPGAIRLGCPPGWYWTVGLTGCRCVEAGSGLPVATRAQVIACIGRAEWDRLVALAQEGITG